MDNKDNGYFEIPILLKSGDFDLRRYASKYVLPAEKYFSMLTEVLELAPNVKTALKRFAERDGDKDSYKYLSDMAEVLRELNCDKFITDIYAILDAYEKGNWRLASVCAEKIEESFDKFYRRLKSAKRKKPANMSLDVSLTELLKNFEAEEANRKLLILAVDDSPVILSSVSALLSDEYKVFTLPKPTMIKEVLNQMTPELFLLDYQMPELNGFELVPIIRGFAEHKETPIIYLTSVSTIDNVTAAHALGACDFVVKPFNPEILREKIAKHIVKKKLF